MRPISKDTLDEWVDGYLANCLDDEQKARLADWLDETDENREGFIEAVEERHALASLLTEKAPAGERISFPASSFGARPAWPLAAAAAVALGLILNAFFLWQGKQGGLDAGEEVASGPNRLGAGLPPDPVAWVRQAIEVSWEGDEPDWTAGADAGERWVRISRGVLQLEFSAGALVALEGPAALRLDAPDACFLEAGRLVVLAPLEEGAFRVGSPSSEVIDLGTEFAMEVDASGRTDVHVLDGEVEVAARESGRRIGPKKRFVETQAARVDPQTMEVGRLNFDGNAFEDLRAAKLWRRQPVRLQFDCGARAGVYWGTEAPAHAAGELGATDVTWNPLNGDQRGRFLMSDGTLTPFELELDYGQRYKSGAIDWSAEPDLIRGYTDKTRGVFNTALGRDNVRGGSEVGFKLRGLPPGRYRIYLLGRGVLDHHSWGNYLEVKAYRSVIGVNGAWDVAEDVLIHRPLRDVDGGKWVDGETHVVAEIEIVRPEDELVLMSSRDRDLSPRPAGGAAVMLGFQIVEISR